jgi:PAS domain S-box-containing protein
MKIRGHVLTLVAMTSVPALLCAAIAGGVFVGLERDRAASALRQSARVIVREIDQELVASIARLETLAEAVGGETVDPALFTRASRALLGARPHWKAIILADVGGRRVIDVSRGPRTELPGVGDRPTFEEVLRTGKPHVSKVLAMPPNRERVIVIGVPLMVDGNLRYVILSAMDAGTFGDRIRDRGLSSEGRVSVVDQTGGTVAGASDSIPGTGMVAALLRQVATEPEGWIEGVDLDGARAYAAYGRSTAAPWTIVLTASSRALAPSMSRLQGAALSAGVLATLLGTLLALLRARRVVGSMRWLADYADATGRGQATVAPPARAIDELDTLTRTVVEAGRLAQQRAAERDEAERRRLRLFEALPQAAWIVDRTSFLIVDANEAAGRLYGYAREDFRDMHVEALSAGAERFGAARLETLMAPTAAREVSRHRTKDGTEIDVELSARDIDRGEDDTVILVAVDVTAFQRLERRRLQQLAAEQAARLEAVAGEAAAADHSRRYKVLAELGIAVLHGTPLQRLLDQLVAPLAAALRAEYVEILEASADRSALDFRAGFGWKPGAVGRRSARGAGDSAAAHALATGGPVVVRDLATETRFAALPFHREHGIVGGVTVVIGDGERPFGVLGVHTTQWRTFSTEDIHLLHTVADVVARVVDRQRSEEARHSLLRREQGARAAAEGSAQRYRLLTEAIPQMVWTSRVDGWVDYFNQRFIDYTGLTFAQSEGSRWQSALHPEDLRPCLQRWNNTLATGEPLEVECRMRRHDGIYRWHLLRAVPVRDQNGGVRSWLGTYTDIDDQKRAEKERQHLLDAEQSARAEAQLAGQRALFLSDASRVLGSSLDCETTLARLARLAVSQIGDWCVVEIVAENGTIERMALAHLDPTIERLSEELMRRYPSRPGAPHGGPRVLATGRAEFYPERPARGWEPGDADPEAAALFSGLRSAMIVPLMARERVLGAMTLLAGESRRPYTPADLALAEELAQRAALAFDNARLYTEAERRRREAQELARVAAGLTQSLDAKVLAQSIVEALLSLFGVRWAALRLLQSDGALKAVAVAGQSEDFEVGHVLPPGVGLEGKVATSWTPLSTPDLLAEPGLVFDAESRERLATMGHRAALAVPFRADAEIVGILSISDDKRREFSAADVALLQTFANQVAVALLHAHLYAQAQRGRQDAEFGHAEADAANRAKDAFLATLSHELRTPLTAMLGWARMLGRGKLDPAATARAIQIIERNTRVQVQLIDDLLDISRIISGKLRLDVGPVPLASLIEDTVDSMRQMADAKAVQVTLELDPAAGVIEGDRARLQQVVSNLLSNAIKFTPEGGQVEIRLGRTDSHADIVVTDTGPGIAPELLPRIFDRFRQGDSGTTAAHSGLGLGLAIVRHLVELHGGTVSAVSRQECSGAIVAVRLPVVAAEGTLDKRVKPREEPRIAPAAVALGEARILVVEDDHDTREFLSVTLAGLGVEVIAAASADDALVRLETVSVQAIVSDIRMPGKDGYAFIREVRMHEARRGGRVPAVAVTAYASAEDRAAALTAGFDAHIAKPVDPDDLARTVSQLVSAGRREE